MSTVQSVIGVLGDFYDTFRDDEDYSEMFRIYDIGFPLAWMIWKGVAVPNDIGAQAIQETWYAFCDALRVDPYNDFESFTEMREYLDSLSEGAT
jgi:hypothetical protein